DPEVGPAEPRPGADQEGRSGRGPGEVRELRDQGAGADQEGRVDHEADPAADPVRADQGADRGSLAERGSRAHAGAEADQEAVAVGAAQPGSGADEEADERGPGTDREADLLEAVAGADQARQGRQGVQAARPARPDLPLIPLIRDGSLRDGTTGGSAVLPGLGSCSCCGGNTGRVTGRIAWTTLPASDRTTTGLPRG